MDGYEQNSGIAASELGKATEAFLSAFRSKCIDVFGTDMGMSMRLNGTPPRARIVKNEPTGELASPATWEAVKKIATEIISEYDLNAADLELIFDIDSYDGPTIVIQHKEA